MGKAQKKTGKGRLDKYYKLAKEQGYRARSAFKLIQLNKKYSFLETARCCIDLCAAPGGVDLVPIKPIPRVVTFASDITTTQCRNLIRNELKDWRADVVLHDGAPNVGTAWIQDAYSQSELVLMSLKLAVDFLVKGGTFVTKIFRSADYNNLIWVFNQLFGKVEATKPPSSRYLAAFRAPVYGIEFMHLEMSPPRSSSFAETFSHRSTSTQNFSTQSMYSRTSRRPPHRGRTRDPRRTTSKQMCFQPEKKRRKRDGYDDGDYTLFKAVPVTDFVRSPDPISVLGSVNQMTFKTEEEKEWYALDITTGDIKANCDDLKVLGKGDFKALLKWRIALREELGLDNKTKDTEDLTETVEIVEEEVDEDQQIQQELERLNAEAAARTKRERRRANEIKTRTIQRMQLQMTAPLDIGMEQHDASLGGQDDFFDLGDAETRLRKRGGVAALGDEDDGASDEDDDAQDGDESESVLDSDEERQRKVDGLEAEMDGLYDAYRDRMRERDAKFKVKESRQRNAEREEWQGIKEPIDVDSDSDEEEGGWDKMDAAKEQDEDSSSDDDSDSEEEAPVTRKRSRAEPGPTKPAKRAKLVTDLREPKTQSASQAAKVWFSQDVFAGVGDDLDIGDNDSDVEMSVDEDASDSEAQWEDEDQDDDDFEIVKADEDDVDMWDVDNENEDNIKAEKIKKHGLITAEAVTLAQQLVNRQKTKTQLINDGFNRYSLNSKEGLPDWFLDEEAKFYKPNIPITKEAVAALRAKQRALDARPIKKVAEAKARKKFKAAQRLEKAMKKAEGVNATADMSEREKAQQIEKVMRKGLSAGKKAKKEVKVVVAKGAHKGLKGRPKGVKGRYTMVDSRMKKEASPSQKREWKRRTRSGNEHSVPRFVDSYTPFHDNNLMRRARLS
ncbi:AdoMet-dependent rRNA methyltransferase SPB1 [Mycena venus]|uniref:AdoMet-dependent rRNA methyltransferase SPB1 n=1 Tax=Mycena venus TaxID=2733690 RepID=A0A8H6XTD2_9AGAR|nr:AdoMet-dependent rRNA methyltransferase SPB1 [Mycena venus]